MKASLTVLAASIAAVTAAGAHEHDAREGFAAGAPGDPIKPARTVEVTIQERPDGTMTFGTTSLRAGLGETVRFVVRNAGKAAHEFRLDSAAGNAAHKAMMAEMPGMAHHDANAVAVAPGTTADLVWRFSKPGTYEFACLIPGHYEAGMHGVVTVAR